MRTHKAEDAPFGETGYLCECDSQYIQCKCQRLSMKITATEYFTILGKNKWIVCDSIQFTFENSCAIFQGITNSAKNLGSAAHGVGVLNSRTIFVADIDFALSHEI